MSHGIPINNVEAVLFDLDGTLVDTAPDLACALNAVLQQQQLEALPYSVIRPIVSNGADALIKFGFGSELPDEQYQTIKSNFIRYYQQNIAAQSILFTGLEQALQHLEKAEIPWGIVTNKPEYLTRPLLEKMDLYLRAGCIVCGDQVNNPKPHPEPIYLACQQLGVLPSNAVYIGDAERDIRSGRLAGLKTIACAYGYIPATDDINNWQADSIMQNSSELLEWLLTLS
ncbi:MAG: phosphoglycolate phosphatase [Cycloclasticus sp.]|nr:phosphoglycolate phosphatase [Cycloclasticus sp.]